MKQSICAVLFGVSLFYAMSAQAAMAPADLGRYTAGGQGQHQDRDDRDDRQPSFSFNDNDRDFGRETRSDRSEGRSEHAFSRHDFFWKLAWLPTSHDGHENPVWPLRHGFFPHNGHGEHHNPPSSVPLPAALPLFGASLAGLAFARRRVKGK